MIRKQSWKEWSCKISEASRRELEALWLNKECGPSSWRELKAWSELAWKWICISSEYCYFRLLVHCWMFFSGKDCLLKFPSFSSFLPPVVLPAHLVWITGTWNFCFLLHCHVVPHRVLDFSLKTCSGFDDKLFHLWFKPSQSIVDLSFVSNISFKCTWITKSPLCGLVLFQPCFAAVAEYCSNLWLIAPQLCYRLFVAARSQGSADISHYFFSNKTLLTHAAFRW